MYVIAKIAAVLLTLILTITSCPAKWSQSPVRCIYSVALGDPGCPLICFIKSHTTGDAGSLLLSLPGSPTPIPALNAYLAHHQVAPARWKLVLRPVHQESMRAPPLPSDSGGQPPPCLRAFVRVCGLAVVVAAGRPQLLSRPVPCLLPGAA